MPALNGAPNWIRLDVAVNPRSVVPGFPVRSDNLQSVTALDVQELIQMDGLQVVLDLPDRRRAATFR